MNALEEKLRAGLTDLAEESAVHVQPDDLIGSVTVLARRRRTGRLLIAAAAAAAAGLIGWTALSPHPVTVQPSPAASPLAPGELTPQFFRFPYQNLTPDLVTVAMHSDGSTLRLSVSTRPEYGGGDTTNGELSGSVGSYFSGKLPGNLFVAVIPDAVESVQLNLGTENATAYDYRSRVDKAAGLSLVVARGYPLGTSLGTPSYVWLGSNGVISDDKGSAFDSLTLTVNDTLFRIYQRAGIEGFGTFPATRTVNHVVDPDGSEIAVWGGTGNTDQSLGRLPAGARDVTVTPRKRVEVAVGTMSDGRTWFVATADYTSASNLDIRPLVRSISYTDAAGKRVTYVPTMK
ncbi:hypothetical protein [Micropruina sonneratiae]|uniref:hypothetical protein n=1 Tax=Micropruina sonneratiae TaxID=2986940 RepID=UPI00222776CD|nr:hypothetical protein [Micropruina sp. KQZ13P-5]MCW3158820.1 hypothetical protein [Micropruina sp. KQZ13P-5]